MEVERNEHIRKLAYQIWQEEGYPHGYEVQHWLKAEAMWQEEHRAKDTAKQPKGAPKQANAPKRAKRKKAPDVSREM
ncbi:MAG: DUF2934 domain-containing protein [Candidatus Binatia bacterium]